MNAQKLATEIWDQLESLPEFELLASSQINDTVEEDRALFLRVVETAVSRMNRARRERTIFLMETAALTAAAMFAIGLGVGSAMYLFWR